jgi:Asp/Glu/hydantoin racemase
MTTDVKTLALIHTSPVLVPAFNALGKQVLENGTRMFHMVDESLIQETIRAGRLEKRTIRRVAKYVDSACQAGASAVLVTCSSIGAAVPAVRPLFDVPVLRIDERMAERAVGVGRRIGVIATLLTTLEPTVELLRDTAAQLGREVEIESCLCGGAFEAVLNGDTETHDRSVTRHLLELAASVDVILLAQASMARVAERIPREATRVPILASPPLAMAQAREVLEALEPAEGALVEAPREVK